MKYRKVKKTHSNRPAKFGKNRRIPNLLDFGFFRRIFLICNFFRSRSLNLLPNRLIFGWECSSKSKESPPQKLSNSCASTAIYNKGAAAPLFHSACTPRVPARFPLLALAAADFSFIPSAPGQFQRQNWIRHPQKQQSIITKLGNFSIKGSLVRRFWWG